VFLHTLSLGYKSGGFIHYCFFFEAQSREIEPRKSAVEQQKMWFIWSTLMFLALQLF
jgi:hypothetical protein